ncbi:pyridoxal-phosphate-dependent aminotransferase family protein [Salidesulfovibrio brasiliensis]|uniref:pyridoxal-phosphate-dependent aminotransferase family protein n=1 Tax=Salidesulfovibrio brasiliensis TaxID=221711 RepID=UPI0006D213AC|nr:aminotransferase class V-fold PLP-dependent enzyme [Salidesulfovibrio brasiliensis]
MSIDEFADLKLFITGPTYIRPEIRKAAALPEFGHRDRENDKRSAPIFSGLKALAGLPDDYRSFLINGSGSTCMEASIRSLVADDEVVLNVTVGAFGDLYHTISLANGKLAVKLEFEPGSAIDPDVLVEAMDKHHPSVVTITHNETSTGVTNDIVSLCKLIRDNNAMPLVDGVSIFGGADLRLAEARPAIYCTATQKSLALPAGFGIGFVGPDAMEKAERVTNKGHSSDILKQLAKAESGQCLTTPNTALLNQMAIQLDHIEHTEGVEARFARHETMRDMVHGFVNGLDGFELFAQEGYRSPTLTTVRCPKGVTAATLKNVLKERMRERGYLFDPGYGKLNTRLEEAGRAAFFRIGHMGDMTPAMLEEYLGELGEELERL